MKKTIANIKKSIKGFIQKIKSKFELTGSIKTVTKYPTVFLVNGRNVFIPPGTPAVFGTDVTKSTKIKS